MIHRQREAENEINRERRSWRDYLDFKSFTLGVCAGVTGTFTAIATLLWILQMVKDLME